MALTRSLAGLSCWRERREPASFCVQVVRELVQHHVVAVRRPQCGLFDVFPGQDDPVRVPGFAGELAATLRHQPVVVVHFVLDPERAGVHEDGLQFIVQARPTEQQQARLRGDRRADFIGDLEPVAADELLFGEKGNDEPVEAAGKVRRQRTRDGNVARDRERASARARPGRRRDAAGAGAAVAAPAGPRAPRGRPPGWQRSRRSRPVQP